MLTKPPVGQARDAVNIRRERFVIAFAGHGIGRSAAIAAGYSRRTARAQAHRLLKDPTIAAAIELERSDRAFRLRVDEDRITAALAAIAFGDVRDVVTWDDKGVALVGSSSDLSDDAAMLVQSVERKERTDAAGVTTATTTVRLADRRGAIESLARIKGMFKDKLEVTGLDGFAARLERSNKRKAERAADPEEAK
jgi:phage terminase small subunit